MKLAVLQLCAVLHFCLLLGALAGDTTTEAPEDDEVHVYSECEHYLGHYAKVYGYTCCQNKTLENAFNEADDIFDNCTDYLHKVASDDLPTAMWRKHACILKTSGAKAKHLTTFKGYMSYMTMNYTEPLKSQIVKNIGKCGDADKEKDELKRLQKFHMCLYKTERTVCHKPFMPRANISKDEAKLKFCKPDENFPYFGDRCCKGKPIPYQVPLVHLDTEKENITARLECSKSYINRQKELDPNIKKGEEELQNHHNYMMEGKMADRCVATCGRNGIHFSSRAALKIDIEELKKSMFTLFSASTRKELLTRLDKYMKVKNYNNMPTSTDSENSTISVQEAVKLMAKKDELTQIHLYCDIQDFIINELEVAALEDYCFDEKYARRFWM